MNRIKQCCDVFRAVERCADGEGKGDSRIMEHRRIGIKQCIERLANGYIYC